MTDRPSHRNANAGGLVCIQCSERFAMADYPEGCPACLMRQYPASLRIDLDVLPTNILEPGQHGMAQFAQWLSHTRWCSLGEGGTPTVAAPGLADQLGIARFAVKNEGHNPTGSHKDRMTALCVARAEQVSAKMIVAASSGNAGASLAAYAAAAGIACTVVTTPRMPHVWRRAITMAQGRILETPNSLDRWRFVADRVKTEDWFPITNFSIPPIGSNPFGVDALKTIAFELHNDLGADQIDAVLVPTSRGDLIWGIYEGYRLLRAAGFVRRIPRLFAVEPFPRLAKVVDGADWRGEFPGQTQMVSIDGNTVTYQAIQAISDSNGGAVVVDDELAIGDQLEFAKQGFNLELSSAAVLTAARKLLRSGVIARHETLAVIASSHGYKEMPRYRRRANSTGTPSSRTGEADERCFLLGYN